MVNFPSIFDEEPDLSTAEGVRAAMRQSYRRHLEMAREATLPSGVSEHEAAMFGVLSSFYEALGWSEATTHRNEGLIWLDVLPFLHLPESDGLEILIEYILWKEPGTRQEAREEWLVDQIHAGAIAAAKDGWAEDVQRAADVKGFGALPWARLLAERTGHPDPA